jgi:hypothetical protein
MKQDEFLQLLGGFIPTPVEDIFEEYKNESGLHWYHLMVSISDFNLLWSCKLFKFYSLCRCRQIADDSSISHEHVHCLISCRILLKSWKQSLWRKKIKLYKTTFKRIICGDHLCGILRYISCKDGQKIGRRGVDGLVLNPHTHYERRVDVIGWLHNVRGKNCVLARNNIEAKMKLKLNLPLHEFESCSCDRGKIGIEKRRESNRKRKAFYETDKGKEVKTRYKKKKLAKEVVINKLKEMGKGGNKAELLRIEIARLIEML